MHQSNFVVFPLDKLQDFAPFFDEFIANLPKEVASCRIIPRLTPEREEAMRGVGSASLPVGSEWKAEGEFFAVSALWVGPPEEMAAVLDPLRAWGPVAFITQPIGHLAMQSLRPELSVPQHRYVRGGYLEAVGTGVLLRCAELLNEDKPAVADFVFSSLGGAVNNVAEQDSAFNGRSSAYLFAIEASWKTPSERESTITWVRRAHEIIEQYTSISAAYTNTVTDEGSPDAQGVGGAPPSLERVRRAYGDEKFARLQSLKGAWDPTNFFHLNLNIPPAESRH
ncbi:BBE domain-containing protein [Microbacterium sp. A94]|uniref:BBE domain-containing protein n=1 Tax=Microbacterium sp. A94 TaxID=3450717 RepID=UPI003F6DA653